MTTDSLSAPSPDFKTANDALYAQLMSVMGLKRPTWLTRCLYPIFRIPVQRMTRLLITLDQEIAHQGWDWAINQFLKHFVTHLNLINEEIIPQNGPLMVICNHPAAYDVVILAAAIHRNDLKIIASDIPIVQLFPHIASYSIPVPYHIPSRLSTVRTTIQHLKNGGAILIFPRGNVEPDPTVSPGAERSLAGWSSSLEPFLRNAPQTRTVVAVASGVLSGKWYKNPLIQAWKKYEQRQKVAEIFQVASQLVTGKTPTVTPTIRFTGPFTLDDLGGIDSPEGALLAALISHARGLLSEQPPV